MLYALLRAMKMQAFEAIKIINKPPTYHLQRHIFITLSKFLKTSSGMFKRPFNLGIICTYLHE